MKGWVSCYSKETKLVVSKLFLLDFLLISIGTNTVLYEKAGQNDIYMYCSLRTQTFFRLSLVTPKNNVCKLEP